MKLSAEAEQRAIQSHLRNAKQDLRDCEIQVDILVQNIERIRKVMADLREELEAIE